MEKIPVKIYNVTLSKIDEFPDDLFVELNEEILDNLGWEEDTILKCTIKKGTDGNVLVIERK